MGITSRKTRTNNKATGKVLASVALVAAAAGVAGLGTYGSFTSTTSASAAVTAGTVKIELSVPGFGVIGANNRLSVPITGLVPGDSFQGAVTLSNTGNQDLGALSLTSVATTSSKLDTDPGNGLQMSIDSCSKPWTATSTTPAYTYACSGTTKTVLASRPVIGTNVPLANLSAVGNGMSDYLRVKFTFPDAADNTFQNLSSVIGFDLTGTQRVATSR